MILLSMALSGLLCFQTPARVVIKNRLQVHVHMWKEVKSVRSLFECEIAFSIFCTQNCLHVERSAKMLRMIATNRVM